MFQIVGGGASGGRQGRHGTRITLWRAL